MEKFYFTYGTDSGYPFRGGWSLIIAPNIKAAAQMPFTTKGGATNGKKEKQPAQALVAENETPPGEAQGCKKTEGDPHHGRDPRDRRRPADRLHC